MIRTVSKVRVEVSPAEVVDRLTILRIKARKITDPDRLAHVRAELSALERVYDRQIGPSIEIQPIAGELAKINEALWQAEDRVRACDAYGDLGRRFIGCARAIWRLNDRRADLKRRINVLLGSGLIDEKQYSADEGERGDAGGRGEGECPRSAYNCSLDYAIS